MNTGAMLHAEVIGGLGPATAFPVILIEAMPSAEMRLICVLKPVMEARTNFAGAVPGLNGLSVEEYSTTRLSPPFTAVCSSGYLTRFALNTLPADSVAVAVDADWSSDLAPASAAASKALCRRDLLS